MTNRPTRSNSWRQWGDHPIVVAIVVIGAIIGVIASWPTIASFFYKEPTEVIYTGRVFDAQNQQPIEGAKVFLELSGVPPVVYTDSEGTFYFPIRSDKTSIEGLVRVDAEKYKVYTRRVIINLDRPEVIDVRLEALVGTSPTSAQVASVEESPSTAPTLTTVQATVTLEPTYTHTPEPAPTATKAPTQEPTVPPVPTPKPVPTTDPRLLFSDNFENGSSASWIVERGTWNMVDLRFKVTQFDADFAELRVGDPSWQDYSVSLNAFGFNHDWGSGNDEVLRIAIRAQDPDNYIWFDISSFVIKYGTRVNGVDQEIAAKGSGVNGPVIGREVTIRIKAQGDNYELYINDQQFGVFVDNSRINGGVYLIARSGSAGEMWIDNVKINSLRQ